MNYIIARSFRSSGPWPTFLRYHFGAGRTRTGEQKWLITTTIKEAADKVAAIRVAAKVAVIKVAATKVVVIRVAAKVAAIQVAAKVAAIRAANHCR